MPTLFRPRLARLVLGLLVALAAIGLSGAPAIAQQKGGPRSPNLQASQEIGGAPLRVVIHDDLSMEVYYNGATQFYADDAGGTFVVVDGIVYGSAPPASSLSSSGFTLISNGAPSGSGTAANPFTVETTVGVGATGLVLVQKTSYVQGQLRYKVEFSISNTSGVARSVRIFHGADLFLNFPGNARDFGYGIYDPATGAVGAASRDLANIQVFIPITAPSAYHEALFSTFWRLIGTGNTAGPGLSNTIDPSFHDVAAGFQWNRDLAPSGRANISLEGAFGLASEIGIQPVAPETQPVRKPALITVAQRIGPNHGVARDGIVTYQFVITNRGEGQARDAILSLPFDPAVLRLLDASFSSPGGWVSAVQADGLTIRTGSLGSKNGKITATVRFQVRADATLGASVAERVSFRWEDAVNGGTGVSNQPITVVAAANDDRATYTLVVTPPSGPAGTVHQIDGAIFVPNEPVGVWYNTPDGEAVELDTYIADAEGNIFLDLSTDDTPAGAYTLVMYGHWSEFTAIGPFAIE